MHSFIKIIKLLIAHEKASIDHGDLGREKIYQTDHR